LEQRVRGRDRAAKWLRSDTDGRLDKGEAESVDVDDGWRCDDDDTVDFEDDERDESELKIDVSDESHDGDALPGCAAPLGRDALALASASG
jgi:hypothetical protein